MRKLLQAGGILALLSYSVQAQIPEKPADDKASRIQQATGKEIKAATKEIPTLNLRPSESAKLVPAERDQSYTFTVVTNNKIPDTVKNSDKRNTLSIEDENGGDFKLFIDDREIPKYRSPDGRTVFDIHVKESSKYKVTITPQKGRMLPESLTVSQFLSDPQALNCYVKENGNQTITLERDGIIAKIPKKANRHKIKVRRNSPGLRHFILLIKSENEVGLRVNGKELQSRKIHGALSYPYYFGAEWDNEECIEIEVEKGNEGMPPTIALVPKGKFE